MRRAAERGSAAVSHVLVQVLVVAVVLALLQLAFALHVRNSAIAAAGEGARRGALAGGTPAEAVARTRALLEQSVPPARVRSARAGESPPGVMRVDVEVDLPVLGPLAVPGALHARGRALIEQEPGDAP